MSHVQIGDLIIYVSPESRAAAQDAVAGFDRHLESLRTLLRETCARGETPVDVQEKPRPKRKPTPLLTDIVVAAFESGFAGTYRELAVLTGLSVIQLRNVVSKLRVGGVVESTPARGSTEVVHRLAESDGDADAHLAKQSH
jgi:hypothetical protein